MRSMLRILVLAVVVMTTTLMVLGVRPGRAMADDIGCQTGAADSQQAWAIGPQTITVVVDLDPSVFGAVQQAFTNWQNSPAGQDSQITFNLQQYDSTEPPTAQTGQYVIYEGHIPPDPKTGIVPAAGTDPVPAQPSPLQPGRTSATTTLNLDLSLNFTDPNLVGRIMAHEIGHTFGLPDAYTNTFTGLACEPGTSVMGPIDPSNLAASPDGPTPDDSDEAISGNDYAADSGGLSDDGSYDPVQDPNGCIVGPFNVTPLCGE